MSQGGMVLMMWFWGFQCCTGFSWSRREGRCWHRQEAGWWSAARCLRRALAAAKRWQRRLPGAGGKVVGVVPVEGEDGGDSSRSLMVEMPPFDEIVKVADSPASSSSSNNLKILLNSAFILSPDIWTMKLNRSSQDRSSLLLNLWLEWTDW